MAYMEFFNPKVEVENICDWIKNYFSETENMNAKAVIGLSGGKDSTIAASLLVRALGSDRVIGVAMPQGKGSEEDTKLAKEIADILDIEFMIVDIEEAVYSILKSMPVKCATKGAILNIPPRVRMTVLYAIAQSCGGRVCNTCNRSEDYVGYSTKYGDTAGDFAILKTFTVRELLAIGEALEIPLHLVIRPPADGLTGKTDEEVLGITYDEIDTYLLDNICPEKNYKLNIIRNKHYMNRHKDNINIPTYHRHVRPHERSLEHSI